MGRHTDGQMDTWSGKFLLYEQMWGSLMLAPNKKQLHVKIAEVYM